MNFILKHSGVLLIYSIFMIYIFTGFKLGMNYKELERLNLKAFQSDTSLNYEEDKECNIDNKIESFTETILLNIENQLNKYALKKNESTMTTTSKKSNEEILRQLNKNVLDVHSLYTEIIIFYTIVFFILILALLIFNKDQEEYEEEIDGGWRYQCPLIQWDIVMTLIEILLIIQLLLTYIKIWNYTYIFKCLKYIGYSTMVWVVLGPTANVCYKYIIYNYK